MAQTKPQKNLKSQDAIHRKLCVECGRPLIETVQCVPCFRAKLGGMGGFSGGGAPLNESHGGEPRVVHHVQHVPISVPVYVAPAPRSQAIPRPTQLQVSNDGNVWRNVDQLEESVAWARMVNHDGSYTVLKTGTAKPVVQVPVQTAPVQAAPVRRVPKPPRAPAPPIAQTPVDMKKYEEEEHVDRFQLIELD